MAGLYIISHHQEQKQERERIILYNKQLYHSAELFHEAVLCNAVYKLCVFIVFITQLIYYQLLKLSFARSE